MAYRLYLADFLSIQRYGDLSKLGKEEKKRNSFFYSRVTPLKFSLEGKLKDTFSIEEIDSLLCSYSDKETFIKELKKHNLSYLSEEERKNTQLTLTYRYKGNIKECPMIFGDLLLFEQATNKRKQKNKQEKIFEKTERLENYIQFIKSLAINKTTRDFLLNPKKIKYIDSIDKDALTTDIFVDKRKENTIIKKGLRSLLQKYIALKEMYDDLYQKNFSTLNIEMEIRKVNDQLEQFFKDEYRNLRKMIEWETQYREILNKCLQKQEVSTYQKEIIKLQIERLNLAKYQRNNPNLCCDIFFVDEEDEYNISITNYNITKEEFKNERINELFKEGGIEAVMEQMDLDEILKDENDAIKLGILPTSKKK